VENKVKLIGFCALLILALAVIAFSPQALASKGRVMITDVNGKPVDLWKTGDTLYITVIDPDENRDSDEVELIWREWLEDGLGGRLPAVKLVDPATGDEETSVGSLTLYETGPDTGEFRLSPGIPLRGLRTGEKAIPGNGVLEVWDNDTIWVYYRDPNDPTDIDADQAKVSFTPAEIKITNIAGEEVPLFNVGDVLFVTLTDPDENTNPHTIQVIEDVILENPRLMLAGEPKAQVKLTLVETGPDTGVFRNPDGILLYNHLGPAPREKALPVRDKDTIVVYYRSPAPVVPVPPPPPPKCATDPTGVLEFCREHPEKVPPGESFTVKVTLTNKGTVALQLPAFTDSLPAGFSPESETNFATSLDPGKSVSFTYTVTASTVLGDYTITGKAKAVGISPFELGTPITVAAAAGAAAGNGKKMVASVVVAQAVATKTDGIEFTRITPDVVAPGETFTVTVKITNLTDTTLKLVAFKDTLPDEFAPASVTNFIQNLGPGETKEWSYRATAGMVPGTYTITGKARATGVEPITLESRVEVAAVPVVGPGLADPNDMSDFTLDMADIAEPNPSTVAFTDEAGREKGQFRIGEEFFITVRDLDANIDSDRVEEVYVDIVDVHAGREMGLKLVETGTNTGVFRNTDYVKIVSVATDIGQRELAGEDVPGYIAVYNRDRLYVRYQDQVDPSLDVFDIVFAVAEITNTEVFDGVGTVNITFTSDLQEPVDRYKIGEDLFVQVIDPDQNESYDLVDTIEVTVKDLNTGDEEVITLEETGPNTGVFFNRAGLPLRRPIEGIVPGDGTLQVEDRDLIFAYYQDPSNPGDFALTKAEIAPRPIVPPIPSTTRFTDAAGRDVAYYVVGDTVYVTVDDRDENRTAGVPDVIEEGALWVENLRTGAKVTVKLIETGPDTGVFRSEPITTGPPGSGAMLEVEPSDTLRATYTDPDDPEDVSSDEVHIEAPVMKIEAFLNFPNPLTMTTMFKVVGVGILKIHVWVYDLTGRLVFDSGEVTGSSLSWDGGDNANGVYLYIIEAIGRERREVSPVMKLVIRR